MVDIDYAGFVVKVIRDCTGCWKKKAFGMQQYEQLSSTGEICPGESELEESMVKENFKKAVKVFVVLGFCK